MFTLPPLPHDDAALRPPFAGTMPFQVCDVREHAYDFDHNNDRASFLSAWDRRVDWGFVAAQFKAASVGAAGWWYPAPAIV